MTNDSLLITLLAGYATIGTAVWKTINWLHRTVESKDLLLDARDNWIKELVNGDRKATIQALVTLGAGQDKALEAVKELTVAANKSSEAAAKAAVEAATVVARAVVAASDVDHARSGELHTQEISLLKNIGSGLEKLCERMIEEGA